MNKLRPVGAILLAASVLLAEASADVSLPKIFTDNMMLQRGQAIRVWGWAAPGEKVQVALAGKKAATQADDKGWWSVELPALQEGENLELTVTGRNTITLKNVIMGDIWLCAGQSNMGIPLCCCMSAVENSQNTDWPKIRFIKFKMAASGYPEEEIPAATDWQVCSPQTARRFTAVGFYFARELMQKTGVPIGIVDDNWGGTAIEPWIPLEGMEIIPELRQDFAARQKALATYHTVQLPKALDELECWIAVTREDLAKGMSHSPLPNLPVHPAANGWSSIYNAMINPLLRFPIKGALWYQGESNGGEGDSYYDKMRALIGGWRKQWGQGDFPFYFVQLANFQAANENPAGGDGWAKIRCAQTKTLSIPNTGMAVSIDLGEENNIHPHNKYDVGLRLARWALACDYGQQNLVVSGPLFKTLKIEGGKVRLFFDHTGSGLMVGQKEGLAPAVENKGGKLKRFALAGADLQWQWADAVIEGQTVVVSSPKVKQPVAVRYAFAGNPKGANLYNREGLPASPFRTDNFSDNELAAAAVHRQRQTQAAEEAGFIRKLLITDVCLAGVALLALLIYFFATRNITAKFAALNSEAKPAKKCGPFAKAFFTVCRLKSLRLKNSQQR